MLLPTDADALTPSSNTRSYTLWSVPSPAKHNHVRGSEIDLINILLFLHINRAVKLVTEAAATVCGQEARDGLIRATIQDREECATVRTKAHILATFQPC